MSDSERTLVLMVPDWSAVAAAIEHDLNMGTPVAVLKAGKVIAVNAFARGAGVALGNNKRAVGLRCPDAAVVVWDEDVDNRHFSAGVGALEGLVARFTLLAPGTLAIPMNSLKHGYPDEPSAVQSLISALVSETSWEFFPGIADTVFAAMLASGHMTRVEPGQTPEFLAAQSINSLEYAGSEYTDFIDVCTRLGLHTLGDLAALDIQEVTSRFGQIGRQAHGFATGLGRTRLLDHDRHESFSAEIGLDAPTTRSDTLGFLARQLATELLEKIRRRGLVCTQVTITLGAGGGRTSQRTWRIEDTNENAIADRLRWQAEGWLASVGQPGAGRRGSGQRGSRSADPTDTDIVDEAPDPEDFSEDGVIFIGLEAAELATAVGATRSLFDENTGAITHTLERVQGLFGPDSVLVPRIQGGWDPAETNLWTPWQQRERPVRDAEAPWPGALSAPRPAVIDHLAVDLLAADGTPVGAKPSGLEAQPRTIRFPSGSAEAVASYSGAWPIESGWWNPEKEVYRTRIQVVTETGRALLLSKEQGQWYLTGWYR